MTVSWIIITLSSYQQNYCLTLQKIQDLRFQKLILGNVGDKIVVNGQGDKGYVNDINMKKSR